MENKKDMQDSFYSVKSIMTAYAKNLTIYKAQKTEQRLNELKSSYRHALIADVINGDWVKFFDYLDEQHISDTTYYDYIYACNYLGLDMTLNRNAYPKDFMRWHDIRIDEYHTAKALAEVEERKKYMQKFIEIVQKYLPLQRDRHEDYICIIAQTPEELIKEGEFLQHCVGKMNYDQKIAKEQSLIFFVRPVDNPDKPFVTLEYSLSSRKIIQCYGYKNSKPDDNVMNYINKKWLPYAKRKTKQIAA